MAEGFRASNGLKGRLIVGLSVLVATACSVMAGGFTSLADPAREEGSAPSEPQISEMAGWTWSELSRHPSPFKGPMTTTVWTGSEMIVWGGEFTGFGVEKVRGISYDPTLDRWSDIPPAPLADRLLHKALWTGREMIIWGGIAQILPPPPTSESSPPVEILPPAVRWEGAAYDPEQKTWRLIAGAPLSPRSAPEVHWTGQEMIVLGGSLDFETPLEDGAAYNPATDQWRTLAPIPHSTGPDEYMKRISLWANDRLLVWTRRSYRSRIGSTTELAIFDPARNTWEAVDAGNEAPENILNPVWTGSEVIVQPFPSVEEGAAFCPARDSDFPTTRGGRYDVAQNSWQAIKPNSYYLSGSAVWTGQVLVGVADLKAQYRPPCTIGPGGPGSGAEAELEPEPEHVLPGPPEQIWAAWSPSAEEWIALPYPTGRVIYIGEQLVWTGREILTSNYRFGPPE